jgi:hypothetical protein
MKTILYILISLISFEAFPQFSVPLTNGQTITFIDAESDNFEYQMSGDTVVIQQLLYDGIDGLEIRFSEQPKSIKISYEIDFFQYTIDDNPAGPLKLTYWTDSKTFEGSILPSHYGNDLSSERTFKFLGFNSQSDLDNHFLKNYSSIKELSLKAQIDFYGGLINDERFIRCCPEYIQQSKEFLNKDQSEFLTLNDLALELGFKTTLLELNDGVVNQYVKVKR